ncbi:uncharacterized protein [Physcomitrium patens]|uniref:Homeobox domain-containing protein n=2 Tax=Physcomitrium patens TaxID=3218 RepID=A0A2K1JIQ6_PHYPA|nr:homeobox-leucine zipper protein ATHB-5-like [Physcomitrium patens]PNR41437.1 hypothetical protein PHYPA_018840 [Physcomitrium patens]|eukprot:XP_024393840.1 homeobox-leucine zipper protein ATHB-5-like [Physcomitrella patens]
MIAGPNALARSALVKILSDAADRSENMAVASLGPYVGQNLNMLLQHKDQHADTLIAMLGSRSPQMSLQQVPRSLEDLEDMNAGCVLKRPYYTAYENPSSLETDYADDGCDEFSHRVEKKRRLSFDQVRSLERNFEVENKLEPERKMQLAKELGLQPRQVAVWFQNRRARWKIKQLECDYDALTQDYNRLKNDFDAALRDKKKLKNEVNRLKGIAPEVPKNVDAPKLKHFKGQPVSPAHSEKSDIVSSKTHPTPTIDVLPIADQESTEHRFKRTMSYDSNSSDVMDAESPRTADSSNPSTLVDASWAQYHNPQFPPENYVGPISNLHLADGDMVSPQVKLEEMAGFPTDQAFLLSQLENQTILPNWWDWA